MASKNRSSSRPSSRRDGRPDHHGRRLRVLVVTRLFPNSVEPHAGSFLRQQITALAQRCDVEVLATIPFLPCAPILDDGARVKRLRRVPAREIIDGVPVAHPRIPYVPGTGKVHTLAPLNAPLYVAGLLPYLGRLRGRFDVVLGTYLYPDAPAAVALARMLGVPCVVRAHGTDVNVISRWPSVRPILRAALGVASSAIGVSRPMVEELQRLGARRAVLVPNGVDRALFHPDDRIAARRALGLPEDDRIVLFVGQLDREKGVFDLIEAFEALREERTSSAHLVIVGEGPEEAAVRAEALRLGAMPSAARGRVVVTGVRPLGEVARHLAACDLLALPSWAEGMPNVVLEALASGRPVVATCVGGIPDAVAHGSTGLLVRPRDPEALRGAIGEALDRAWDEAAILASAPPSWDESAAHLHDLLAMAAWGREPARKSAPEQEHAVMKNGHGGHGIFHVR
jgi:glycosyltransferase involved in cell wall biosynthesis